MAVVLGTDGYRRYEVDDGWAKRSAARLWSSTPMLAAVGVDKRR